MSPPSQPGEVAWLRFLSEAHGHATAAGAEERERLLSSFSAGGAMTTEVSALGEACAAAVGPQGQLLPAALQRLAAGLALRRADVPLSAIDCTRHASPSLC